MRSSKDRSKATRWTRQRDFWAVNRLREIAAKLQWGEPLEPDEAMLAGKLVHRIAHGDNPVPDYFHQPTRGRPKNEHNFCIALHYFLLEDAAKVADIWCRDVSKVYRFGREHRAECETQIHSMTAETRARWLKDLKAMAAKAVAKKR